MTGMAAQSLYSRDVLRLAMTLPHDDRLACPDGSATRRSSLCGSQMSADVALSQGAIAAVAFRPKACALGQASAAVLRDVAIGRTADEIDSLAAKVRQALNSQGPMPNEYQTLAYVCDYPARHGAIMLPFDTLLAALTGDESDG